MNGGTGYNGSAGHSAGQAGHSAGGQAPTPRTVTTDASAPAGYGSVPAEAPGANGDGHHGSTLQTGTLPPASPPPAAYTPPTPRLPEAGEVPSSPADRPGLYTPPAAHSPSPTSYATPVSRSDFDDDVDVPPFMKR